MRRAPSHRSVTAWPPSRPADRPTAPCREPSPAARRSLASRITAPRDAAAITGWVVYQGTPPKPKAINFGAEKVCASLHGDKPALYETLVVNPNGTVKGALVTIR